MSEEKRCKKCGSDKWWATEPWRCFVCSGEMEDIQRAEEANSENVRQKVSPANLEWEKNQIFQDILWDLEIVDREKLVAFIQKNFISKKVIREVIESLTKTKGDYSKFENEDVATLHGGAYNQALNQLKDKLGV